MAIKFTGKDQKPKAARKPRTSPELDKALNILLNMEPKAAKKRAPNGTFDRTAYQREYMRKRRAKLKEKRDE